MEDLIGRQFGPYQIVAALGEGGMAAVYRAYQPGTERYVALKVLPRHFADDPEFTARFQREARILAQLQHPHILPVFDYGQAEGYSYIVMPFVPGGTLTESMQGQPLPLPRIRQVISQVGDALNYAHGRGLIHRDVKPSNVLIDESGNCLLTDFGLARMAEASVKLTAAGTIMGTPAYMSPEQGAGSGVDARSDIYSLGIILYEMATGRVPYRAETPVAVVFMHVSGPLPLPRSLNPDLPEAVERVILKALARNPDERYQTAEDLVAALKRAIPETPIVTSKPRPNPLHKVPSPTLVAPPAGGAIAQPAPKRRMTGWAWVLTVVLLGLIAAGGVFLANRTKDPFASVVALVRPNATASALPPTQVTQPPAALSASSSEVPGLQPTLIFAPTLPAKELSSLGPWVVFNNETGIWGVNQDGTGLTRLTSNLSVFQQAVVAAPSGGYFAYVTGDPPPYGHVTLHIFSLPLRIDITSIPLTSDATEPVPGAERGPKTDAVEAAVGHPGEPSLAWSPDGKSLAFIGVMEGDTADLYKYSIDTGKVTRLTSGPSQAYAPSWSPDGKYVVHLGANTFGTGAGYAMAGAWAALANGSGVISLENVNLGEGASILGWHGTENSKFYLTSWKPGCGGYDLQEVDVVTGKVLHLWKGTIASAMLNPRGIGLILSGAESCGADAAVIRVLPSMEVRLEPVGIPVAVKWLEETRMGHGSYAVASTNQGVFLFENRNDTFRANPPPGQVGLPSQAPGTDILLWTGDGLWMGNLTNLTAAPVQIFDRPVSTVFSSADADHLVFFSEDQLWVASASDKYQPVLVAPAKGSQSAVWVAR